MIVARKRKVEVARLAGFGLVLAGVLALVLAVLSAQNAGASNPTAQPRHLSCHTSSTDQIGWAVMYGACSSTTMADTSSSQPDHQCGCGTTTTYVTTTTQEHHCGCSTTTTEATTPTSEETTTTASSTTTTMATGPTESTTTGSTTTSTMATGPTESTTPVSLQGGGTPTTQSSSGPVSGGVTTTKGAGSGPATTGILSAAEAAQQLPFTGSSSFPLAGLGLLLIASGSALALRRRHLAR